MPPPRARDRRQGRLSTADAVRFEKGHNHLAHLFRRQCRRVDAQIGVIACAAQAVMFQRQVGFIPLHIGATAALTFQVIVQIDQDARETELFPEFGDVAMFLADRPRIVP